MGSIKFNYGDLVILKISYSKFNNNSVRRGSIGIIVDPKGDRSYNIVKVFGSDDNWYLKDDEMDLIEPTLTANEERAKV